MIEIQFPNTKQVAQGFALNAILRAGIRKYPPLEASSESFEFQGTKEWLGVPTLTTLALKGVLPDGEVVHVELLECIITITQDRNIVTTPLQGMDGTVKEYISDGDYQISIDAAISGYQEGSLDYENSKAYPMEQMKPLMKLLKLKDSLKVHCDFLTLFDITDAVVKTYGMIQETHSNRQSFNIQLLSDTAYEVKLKRDA